MQVEVDLSWLMCLGRGADGKGREVQDWSQDKHVCLVGVDVMVVTYLCLFDATLVDPLPSLAGAPPQDLCFILHPLQLDTYRLLVVLQWPPTYMFTCSLRVQTSVFLQALCGLSPVYRHPAECNDGNYVCCSRVRQAGLIACSN